MEVLVSVGWVILVGIAIVVIGIIGLGFTFRRWPNLRRKAMARLLSRPDTATFIATQKTFRSSIEDRLPAADAETRVILENKLAIIKGIIEDPDKALQKTRQRVFDLTVLLKKYGKTIDKARLIRATKALEIEDYRAADTILTEIAAKPDINAKSAARVAFGRAVIARSEFRWQDAVDQYSKSTQLVPNFMALFWSRDLLDRLEQHKQAALVGQDLVAMAKSKYGKTHEITVSALETLAGNHYLSGDYSAAESCCREVLAMGPKGKSKVYPDNVLNLKMLVLSLKEKGAYAEAEPFQREILEIVAEMVGTAHPDYITGLSRLAFLLDDMEDYERAEPLYREVLKISENTIGCDHPKYVTRLLDLANMLKYKEDYDAAEPLFREALEIEARTIGTDHPKYATRLNRLAVFLKSKGDYDAAEPLLREALLIDANTIGKNSTRYALHLANLADLWRLRGDLQTAEPMYREALGIYADTIDGYNYCHMVHLTKFSEMLQLQGDFSEAEALLRQVVTATEDGLGADHSDTKAARKAIEDLFQGMP